MKITQITFDPKGDGYDVVFINGLFFNQGDEYHDKISAQIEGFISFLKFSKLDHSLEKLAFEPKKKNVDFYDFDYQADLDEKLDDYLERIKKNFKPL